MARRCRQIVPSQPPNQRVDGRFGRSIWCRGDGRGRRQPRTVARRAAPYQGRVSAPAGRRSIGRLYPAAVCLRPDGAGRGAAPRHVRVRRKSRVYCCPVETPILAGSANPLSSQRWQPMSPHIRGTLGGPRAVADPAQSSRASGVCHSEADAMSNAPPAVRRVTHRPRCTQARIVARVTPIACAACAMARNGSSRSGAHGVGASPPATARTRRSAARHWSAVQWNKLVAPGALWQWLAHWLEQSGHLPRRGRLDSAIGGVALRPCGPRCGAGPSGNLRPTHPLRGQAGRT